MRIGPSQYQILAYIAEHPGCSSLEARKAVTYVGGGWSNSYSDYTMTSLRRRGLVEARQECRSRLSCYLTPAGRAALGLDEENVA